MTQREEFEEAARVEGLYLDRITGIEQYSYHTTQVAWVMWQAAQAAQPKNTSGEWMMIAPDGKEFTGPTPLKAAFPASKYRLEIDPVAAAKFAEVIDQIAAEGEAEREQCMRDYGTLNCPACGGSGHIADAMAAQPVRPDPALKQALMDNTLSTDQRAQLYSMIDGAQPAQIPAWLPIESAPKDGYFLVYEDGAMRALFRSNGVFQPVGYPALVTSNHWNDRLVGDDAKRALEPMGYRLEICDGCCENPTHWMPLPAAPDTSQKEESNG